MQVAGTYAVDYREFDDFEDAKNIHTESKTGGECGISTKSKSLQSTNCGLLGR